MSATMKRYKISEHGALVESPAGTIVMWRDAMHFANERYNAGWESGRLDAEGCEEDELPYGMGPDDL